MILKNVSGVAADQGLKPLGSDLPFKDRQHVFSLGCEDASSLFLKQQMSEVPLPRQLQLDQMSQMLNYSSSALLSPLG